MGRLSRARGEGKKAMADAISKPTKIKTNKKKVDATAIAPKYRQ
jgi:hypothetical protein